MQNALQIYVFELFYFILRCYMKVTGVILFQTKSKKRKKKN